MLFPVQITLTELFNFIISQASQTCVRNIFSLKAMTLSLHYTSHKLSHSYPQLFISETCLNVIFNTSLYQALSILYPKCLYN